MDMRDEFSTSPFISRKRKLLLQEMEAQFLKRADGLLSVSKPIVDIFEKNAGNTGSKLLFSEVRNGFDFEINEKCVLNRNDKFCVSYMGSFYSSRKPTNFFAALVELIKEGRIEKESVRIQFWSASKSYLVPSFLKSIVFHENSISEKDSVLKMQQSDVLLLVHPTNEAKGVFTGKLFEYLGSYRPVLALVDPEDVAAQLIQECNAGWVAPDENIADIKIAIMSAYEFWEQKKEYKPNFSLIHSLHRKHQVDKLDKEILTPLLT